MWLNGIFLQNWLQGFKKNWVEGLCWYKISPMQIQAVGWAGSGDYSRAVCPRAHGCLVPCFWPGWKHSSLQIIFASSSCKPSMLVLLLQICLCWCLEVRKYWTVNEPHCLNNFKVKASFLFPSCGKLAQEAAISHTLCLNWVTIHNSGYKLPGLCLRVSYCGGWGRLSVTFRQYSSVLSAARGPQQANTASHLVVNTGL